jgi:hypothetical protein
MPNLPGIIVTVIAMWLWRFAMRAGLDFNEKRYDEPLLG